MHTHTHTHTHYDVTDIAVGENYMAETVWMS
jgi:hypothetical protein